MTRIVICGISGRMGRALRQTAGERSDLEIVGGVATSGDASHDVPVVALKDAGSVIAQADVVIDFSSAAGTHALLEQMADALVGRALIIGTTGLDDATERRIAEQSERSAVLTAANFSIGINLLLGLTERVAATLDAARYDIEIIESHHRRKTDAPSGTALALGAAAARGRGADLADVRLDGRTGDTGPRPEGQIGFHAVRGGGIAGEHRIVFAAEREVLELRHEALDRAVFAAGALTAAHWLAGRAAGRYTMQHVLGF